MIELLNDNEKFIVQIDNTISFSFNGLDNTISELLSEFSFIKQVYGEASIDRININTSSLNPKYIRVATDSDSTEIVMMEGSSNVYEIDGSDFDFQEPPFPSIYHWFLFSSCVVYPEVKSLII